MRRFVGLAVVGVLTLCGGVAGLAGLFWAGTGVDTAGAVQFTNRLAVPPLAASRPDGSGGRVFDLRAGQGRHDFGAGPVSTWGFNGAYLGPTLRVARGERVTVNVANGLPEETSVHWHGAHLPARMDGGPHQSIPPGGTWSPTWTVDQPAATLWYHPHPHGGTETHVYRGLAGMLIVDDERSAAPGLPREYGVDDVPVVVQDKSFAPSGRLAEGRSAGGIGILGDAVVVNGTLAPYLDVAAERVRLRLLNGSTARSYDFGLADDRPVELVGTDGGLLPAPRSVRRVPLSPGERAEIVVTLRPGERTVLRSTPPRLGVDPVTNRLRGGADTLDVLELRAAAALRPSPAVPARLAEPLAVDPAAAVQRRAFQLSGDRINGRRMDLARVDAVGLRGTVEVWRVSNTDGTPHNFHVHGVGFRVVTVDGRTPPAHLAGPKDTVYVPPGSTVELALRLPAHADPATPYMFHCHLLFHEDQGMMGQFLVLEPGQRPQPPAGHRHGG